MRSAQEATAVLATLATYERRVLPRVRRELAVWGAAAERVPDPELRAAAISALTDKSANVEAVAVFATLAPRRGRAAVVRAIVALQVAIDYLDLLGERPGAEPLRDGLALHGALGAALGGAGGPAEWYAHHPHAEDGGYLAALAVTCRDSFDALPAAGNIAPLARRAAERCGAGQAHTHAAPGDPEALRGWAQGLAVPGVEWWEAAAGASSSVAAHALIALAARPSASAAQGEAIDAAYFPAVGALTVLLDDLVDRDADRAAGEHSYLDYYADASAAAVRLEALTELAHTSLARTPQPARHAAVLAGVLGYYLGSPGAMAPYAAPVRARLLSAGGPLTRLIALTRR